MPVEYTGANLGWTFLNGLVWGAGFGTIGLLFKFVLHTGIC